jgi:hypothetical protein
MANELLRGKARVNETRSPCPGAGPGTELLAIARFTFHPGKLDEYKRLAAQCMEIVRTKDTGTLQYDIFFNDEQ